MDVDLENMTLEDVDYLRNSLKQIVDAGDFKDPSIREAAALAKELQNMSD